MNRGDWHTAIDENYKFIIAQDWFLGFKNKNNIFEEGINKKLLDLIIDYFTYSNLSEILGYLNGQRLQSIETISNSILQDVAAQLGAKVLNELPKNIPGTIENYGIPVDGHKQIKLLLKSPIAAAESIAGVEKDKSIWSCKEFAGVIRRNMQYSQYLSPEFYKKVLIYTIGKLN